MEKAQETLSSQEVKNHLTEKFAEPIDKRNRIARIVAGILSVVVAAAGISVGAVLLRNSLSNWSIGSLVGGILAVSGGVSIPLVATPIGLIKLFESTEETLRTKYPLRELGRWVHNQRINLDPGTITISDVPNNLTRLDVYDAVTTWIPGGSIEEQYGVRTLWSEAQVGETHYFLRATQTITANFFEEFYGLHHMTINEWEAWHEPLLERNDPELTVVVRTKLFGQRPTNAIKITIGDETIWHDPEELKSVPLYADLSTDCPEQDWPLDPVAAGCTARQLREAIDMMVLKGENGETPSIAWRQRHLQALYYLGAPPTWTQRPV